jgi:16S rRNA (uracil1498-N3)-methyltransferase
VARFYLNTPFNAGQNINLPIDIVRHMQVLRLTNGESIYLFNGNGSEYEAKLLCLDKKVATAKIIKQLEPKQRQLSLNTISLAIGLISSDKMDLVVQKATELGIQEIIPLYSEYAQRISSERLNKRIEHWQNIIISSCMQCGQNYLPSISRPILYEELLNNTQKYNLKIILCPHEVDKAQQYEKNRWEDSTMTTSSEIKHTLLMVGSEGGWSPTEIVSAVEHGFIPVKLGNLILRAETAVIAGISLLNSKLKIWE